MLSRVRPWWPVVLIASISISYSVLQTEYDWDLDHEIYFASRLLSGELSWGEEYNDKLPFLQVLFLPSALFRSIIPWIIFCLLACVLLVWSAQRLTIARDYTPSSILQREEVVAFGCVLFWSATVIPGGLAHIDLVAGCLGLTGLLLVPPDKNDSRISIPIFAASVACCAVSVSIRPNFLFAIGLVWISRLFTLRPNGFRLRFRVHLIVFAAASSLLFLFLNFFPLMAIGRFKAVVDGLTVLVSRRNPESGVSAFIADPFSFPRLFVMVILSLSIFTVAEQKVKRVCRPIEFTCALFSLGLACSFVGRHWWEHYAGLFGASGSLLIAARGIRVFGRLRPTFREDGQPTTLRSTVPLFAASLLVVANLFLLSNLGQEVSNRDVTLREVRAVLKSNEEHELSWLAPYDMRSHWELRQSRHGFPHAAHFLHIERNWWEDAPKSSSFAVYRSAAELCEGLLRSDLDIIFVESSSRLHLCLSEAASRSPTFELDEGNYNINLSVWRSKVGL